MSLVLQKVATYREVCEFWDLDEVVAMHEILDIRADLEADEMQKAKLKNGVRR